MSANTTIQEGGKGYPFGPVKCLMVEGDNGEFYPWYPEADRALSVLSVDKNGVYRASDNGVYGWNRVSVNVTQADRVTGRDPETGEEKTVKVNPETGELVETVVPVEIRVTTLPTKTVYTDGETIDYSGIVVRAYSSTGRDMGAVPFSELVFPQSIAIYDASKVQPDSATIDDPSILSIDTIKNSLPIVLGAYGVENDISERHYGIVRTDTMEVTGQTSEVYTVGLLTENEAWVFAFSLNEFTVKSVFKWSDGTNLEIRELSVELSGLSPKTYYVTRVAIGKVAYFFNNPVLVLGPYNLYYPGIIQETKWEHELAEVILFGAVTKGGIPIPVWWARTGDGAILETTFNITVMGGN